MRSTRTRLDAIAGHLEESMGLRAMESETRLAPVAERKDAGRRPLRQFGRVEVRRVVPDPAQPRVQFSDEAIERLAHSIRERGQLTPIRVRWSEDLQKWVIISGECRWRAAQRAGLPEIDCFFHETPLSASEILEQQLIENCLREDLQPIEEARAFATLMDLNGWTAKMLAESLRISPSRVSRALALLRLPEDVQQKVNTGELSSRSAYEISRLQKHDPRLGLAEQAVKGRMTVRQTVREVRRRRGKRNLTQRGTKQTFMTEDGWTVVVRANKKGSYEEIESALAGALEEVRHRIECGRQL